MTTEPLHALLVWDNLQDRLQIFRSRGVWIYQYVDANGLVVSK